MPRTAEIQLHKTSEFKTKQGKYDWMPKPPLRFMFVGTSGAGKGTTMIDLILHHYRGCFDRIFLYSRSATLDKSWEPVGDYVRQNLKMEPDEEWKFDDFDPEVLNKQIQDQMAIADWAKEHGKTVPMVLFLFDDLIDDARLMKSHGGLIVSLLIRGRHFGANVFISTQKYRAISNVVRINMSALFVFPATKLERKAVIEEVAGLTHTEEAVEEMLNEVSRTPHGFLFIDLKQRDPSKQFMHSLKHYITA
jgi:hypothetical protein